MTVARAGKTDMCKEGQQSSSKRRTDEQGTKCTAEANKAEVGAVKSSILTKGPYPAQQAALDILDTQGAAIQ